MITGIYGVAGCGAAMPCYCLADLLVVGLAALILKPWKRKADLADNPIGISQTILAAVVGACVVRLARRDFL